MSPSLETLERWAKALKVELHHIFDSNKRHHLKPPVDPVVPLSRSSERLAKLAEDLPHSERRLLVRIARELSKKRAR
jgi:hypothetical protein